MSVESLKKQDSQSKKLSQLNNTNKVQTSNKLDIQISNVVCSYSTRCHLNLRRIAMEGMHVEYKRENNMVNMRLRNPLSTATIWSSGKITCTGATTELDAYRAARRFCRLLQKMKFKVKLCNYRVVNVLGTCSMPFDIDLIKIADTYREECSYEPELHPGATYKIKEFRATLKLFTTGSITLTAPSVSYAQKAIEFIYPILNKYKRGSSSSSTVTNADCNDAQLQQAQTTDNSIDKQSNENNNYSNNNNNNNSNNNSCTKSSSSHLLGNVFNSNGSNLLNSCKTESILFNNTTENSNHHHHHHHHHHQIPSFHHLNHHSLYASQTNTPTTFSNTYDSFYQFNNNYSFSNYNQTNISNGNGAVNSYHHSNTLTTHCFNDNLLIDHVFDDFLQ